MPKGQHLPAPPRIDAISRMDDLEAVAEEFAKRNGYSAELISHWDPKPKFEQQIAGWVPAPARSGSLVNYVYTSYLEFGERIRARICDTRDRGLTLTPSGTASIAIVVAYLKSVGITKIHVVTPAYFALEALTASFGISISYREIARRQRRYVLPTKCAVAHNSGVWNQLLSANVRYCAPH